MKGSTRAVAALGIGYVLGRRRRLRTAVIVSAGMAVGGTTVGGLLLKRAGKLAGSADLLGKVSPEVSEIASVVRNDLLTAGKAAATTMVTSRLDSLADSIHDRAELVRNPADQATGLAKDTLGKTGLTGDEEADEEDGEEPEDSRARDTDDDADEADDDYDDEPAPAVRRTGAARRSPVTRTAGATSTAAKATGTKAAGTAKSAARTGGGRSRSTRTRG